MAVENIRQRKSKHLLFNGLLIILLSWFILFAWNLSTWGLKDFNAAWLQSYQLAKQQSFAVAEFNDASIANYFKAHFSPLSTQTLTNKIEQAQTLVKAKLNTYLPEVNTELDNTFVDISKVCWQLVSLMSLTTHVVYVKALIIIASIPLFILTATVGLVDGLNQRAIRTASLGRESSYLFHQLNRYFKSGLLLLLMLWLALPLILTPALFFVPVSIFLSIIISLTASRFKKYL